MNSPALDYSSVDTREKALALVRQGKLAAVMMHPALFGGIDVEENVIFVPRAIAAQKARIEEEIILPLVRSGKTIEYRVSAQNDKWSFVPLALTLWIWTPDPKIFRLAIWSRPSTTSAG